MSYIQSLKFVKDLKLFDLKNLSKNDIVKIEKLLTANQQLNNNFNKSSIGLFLDSLQTHKEGFLFLVENPYLVAIVLNQSHYRKGEEIKFNTVNEKSIKAFFKVFLEQDLTTCCNLSFSKNQYRIINELLRYKHFLPETIIYLIESKTESKLDYFMGVADKIVDDNSILSKPFIDLIRLLNSKIINRKLNELNSLTTSYAIKAVRRPGIVHFFYVMTNGLMWVGKAPQTIEEKIEKKEVLKDFKFMSIILGFIFALFLSTIVYTNSQGNERKKIAKEKQIDKFNKSVYGYLTLFDSTQIKNVEYIDNMPSGKLSPNYFNAGKGNDLLSRNCWVINNSNYELIVLPDEDTTREFGFLLHSYYVKPKDSIRVKLLFNRIYVGKQLAVFVDTSDEEMSYYHDQYYIKRMPRFVQPIVSASEILKNRFEFRGDIELKEKDNDALILQSKTSFFVNGRGYKSYILKE